MGRRAQHSEAVAQRVAAHLKFLRESRGWSIRELARHSGLAPESVSRSERGVTEVTITNLVRLCQGLGVTTSEFFAEIEQEPLEGSMQVMAERAPEVLVDEFEDLRERLETMPATTAKRFIRALEILAGPKPRKRKRA